MKPAIQVDNLSKRYKLGRKTDQGVVNLSERIGRGIKYFSSRFSKISNRSDDRDFWALKDINFQVEQGDVVGFIGRNGAGKSTLLKILSRIIEPTTGSAGIYGRLGALLEVGTGFHPELTGRENIFLNGSILGMKRQEIMNHFDDIVDFAEISDFLDTPVKRYSSGMYVRLAFAVAAHLNPEILVVDEVLAVGDYSFQKKCIGKMGEVASQGRTVLFVSHNLQAVSQLTNRIVIINAGHITFTGSTAEGLSRYTSTILNSDLTQEIYEAPPTKEGVFIKSARARTSEPKQEHICGNSMDFEFIIHTDTPKRNLCFSFHILNDLEKSICHFWLLNRSDDFKKESGLFKIICRVPKFRLYMGKYSLTTYLTDRRSSTLHEVLHNICPFEVSMRGIEREEYDWNPTAMAYWEDCNWLPTEQIG